MIYTHLFAAILAAMGAWHLQGVRHSADMAEMQSQHATALARSQADLLAQERAITKKYQGALNAATQRETISRRNADRTLLESDGLRAQLTDAARRIASAPPAAVAEYAATVSGLFDHCQRDYQDVAGKATGHANDVRTHRDGWPVAPPRVQ